MAAMTHPESHYCCITHEIMRDPLIDRDGNSYDRAAIERWLAEKGTSPMTRNPMSIHDLVPNRALKDAIDAILTGNPTPVTAAPPVHSVQDTTRVEQITSGSTVRVTVHPPEGQAEGIDICLCIDASGSMGGIVKASRNVESDGLTRLDLAQHSAKTIINGCREQDRVSIVRFSNRASVVSPLTETSVAGKARLNVALAGITAGGATNIWDAMKKSMDTLMGEDERPSVIMLLTDGQPNIIPPRGHKAMLEQYLDRRPNLRVSINTYGFGYDLDSDLLEQIAQDTHGSFAFIPDSGMVGTTFIHAGANAQTTMSCKALLKIETEGEITIQGMPAERYTKTGWGYQLPFGPITYGQSRDIVFEATHPVQATLTYGEKTLTAECSESIEEISNDRQAVVHAIQTCAKLGDARNFTHANTLVNQTLSEMSDPDLKKDLDGEIRSALQSSSWSRWGRHYLKSLANAHERQQCNNFKDPGVQSYGGSTFETIRNRLDDIFDNMEAPKPSGHISRSRFSSSPSFRLAYPGINSAASAMSYPVGSAAAPPGPIRMSTYRDSSGPCFSGNSLVEMADGSNKLVGEVVKGDYVKTNAGNARVVCVMETAFDKQNAPLVHLAENLWITEWHPVRMNGKWQFPARLTTPATMPCSAVFSFLLEQGHSSMYIGGVECITLAHEITGDPVASHSFYGSRHSGGVYESLSKMHGFGKGHVVLKGGACVIRDSTTHLVCGLYQKHD